jgi:hypothetical protein
MLSWAIKQGEARHKVNMTVSNPRGSGMLVTWITRIGWSISSIFRLGGWSHCLWLDNLHWSKTPNKSVQALTSVISNPMRNQQPLHTFANYLFTNTFR